jgi:hypothetical protein
MRDDAGQTASFDINLLFIQRAFEAKMIVGDFPEI